VHWAISARGDRLAYSDRERQRALWRLSLKGGGRLEQFLSSSAADLDPEISPDGNRIAFVSERQSGLRVWISGSDGTNPIDIAQTVGPWPGPARWSPDGNQIAFECQNEGNDDICVVSARGGAVRRLTRNPARDTLPSWAHDGKWIYFTSNRSGTYQVWKAPADATDAGAVKLTTGEGFNAVESVDGGTLYFARSRFSSEIWKIPVAGGQESRVASLEMVGTRSQNYAVRQEGIYYVTAPDPEHWFELWLYRFATGKSESIRRIEKRIGEGLTISPDGRWLLFAADEARNGDLYLVENFR
jgi:Tol biopolymer transport system component